MGKVKVEKVKSDDAESNQKFSLKFITSKDFYIKYYLLHNNILLFIKVDEKTTHEMAELGYNHLLDLTVKRSNKWSSVLGHLGKKWSKVNNDVVILNP